MAMYPNLPKPFFVLAPMYDVTDTVFRQIIAELAPPDLFVTEFVNVDGLQSNGREHLLRHLQFTAREKPIIAQLWGVEPKNFYTTARELVDMGFAGVDINMGCPVKAITKRGLCSALIRNRTHAVEIIKATQEGAGGHIPVSVKTRLGFENIDYTWHELLLRQNIQMLAVHGRIARQMSRGAADWEAIGTVRALRDQIAPETLIVGNGDITSRRAGLDLADRHKLDGIMIGRGVFQDPFVFAVNSLWDGYPTTKRIELYAKHVRLFADTWGNDQTRVATLNKFCKVYINGFEGAKEMREQLMSATTTDELLAILGETYNAKQIEN